MKIMALPRLAYYACFAHGLKSLFSPNMVVMPGYGGDELI